jgi:antitoxin (DNA-binding transcriptional repressor) of toxin-antitoxin stability system
MAERRQAVAQLDLESGLIARLKELKDARGKPGFTGSSPSLQRQGRLVSIAIIHSQPCLSMRIVNVHAIKTHLSRLLDDAHASATILLAKAGKPWARLMPLEPLPPEELSSWDNSPLLPDPSAGVVD